MNIHQKIIEEANNYFERNKYIIVDPDEASKSAHLTADFIDRFSTNFAGGRCN